jgi:hypothetical protein
MSLQEHNLQPHTEMQHYVHLRRFLALKRLALSPLDLQSVASSPQPKRNTTVILLPPCR